MVVTIMVMVLVATKLVVAIVIPVVGNRVSLSNVRNLFFLNKNQIHKTFFSWF